MTDLDELSPAPAAPPPAGLHVLNVIASMTPETGGPARSLTGLSLALRALGCRVSVLATEPRAEETELTRQLRTAGVDLTVLSPVRTPLWWHPKTRATLRRLLPTVDIVHIYGLWEDVQWAAARAAARHGVPYFLSPRGMLDPWSLSQGELKKRAYRALRLDRMVRDAAALHYTSEPEALGARRLGYQTPEIIVPNGLDLSEFRDLPPRGALRSSLQVGPDEHITLFFGRVHPKKGPDILLRAFAEARSPGDVLVFAGPCEDDYRAALEAMASALGISERVRFAGMLHGRARLEALIDADVFALPSHQENFGVAVVEALACGTPVLLSDKVNIHPEIVAAGAGACSAPEEGDFAAMLREWRADPVRRSAAARAARDFALRRYDWGAIASRWLTHYRAFSVHRP